MTTTPRLRVLLTGASGQVGTELRRRSDSWELLAPTRAAFDLARPDELGAWLRRQRPDLIVNAGAYTAVDRAEDEEALAFRVNAEAVDALAGYANEAGIPLLQLSTDYVFDGTKSTPYVETDPPCPVGAYGRSKAAGETAARNARRHAIVRLSWIFAAHGSNFVRTMLRLAGERPKLRVVADQAGGPTWAGHIAESLVVLIRALSTDTAPANGTWHLGGEPHTNWHAFACEVMLQAHRRGLIAAMPALDAIATHEYPTRATRPANSRLDGTHTRQVFGLRHLDWRQGLAHALDEMAGTAAPQ